MPIEDTTVYRRYCAIADEVWDIAIAWDSFARDTVGKQLVTAIDSAPANLVEGDGRGTDPDAIRFFRYARASAREALNWLRRAEARKLIPADVFARLELEIIEATKALNGLIRYRRNKELNIKEESSPYGLPDSTGSVFNEDIE